MNNTLYSIFTILKSNLIRLPSPYKLTFAITYRCNSRCTICNIWKKPYKKELTLSEIHDFFKKNTFFTWVNLTGGELILRNDLVSICKTILTTQKHLLFLNFPTNGLLTERIVNQVKEILELKPPHFLVSVSLDGPESLHDQLRGIKGNWKHAITTYTQLKALRSSRFDCYFGMTISNYNFMTIEQTYRELKNEIPSLKRSDIHFNIAHQSSHYYGNEEKHLTLSSAMIKSISEFNQKKPFAWTKIAWIERIYQRLIQKYITTKKTPISCRSLSSSIFIDPYGNIFPCSMWNQPLGNIKKNKGNLMTMWNDKKMLNALHIIQMKRCANCWTPCEAYQSILGNLGQPILWKSMLSK
ncbi:MAG: radical SAM protein [Microgenomates group bacterium]